MKSTFAFGAAAALFLLAAPLSIAQVTTPEPTPEVMTPTTPETNPAPSTAPTPAVPSTNPAPSTAPTPAAPSTSQSPAAPAVQAQNEATGNAACRTRKDVGEQCSCLSAPTDFGTSQAHDTGSHNVCVVPSN